MQCNGRCQGLPLVLDCDDCTQNQQDAEDTSEGTQTADKLQGDFKQDGVGIETFIRTYNDGPTGGNERDMHCLCKSRKQRKPKNILGFMID